MMRALAFAETRETRGAPAAGLQLIAAAPPEVVLDLSRLISRVLHASPTGIDRVEMAYALGLRRRLGDRLAFAAVHPAGLHGRLPHAAAIDFLEMTAERWERETCAHSSARAWRRAVQACLTLRPACACPPAPCGARVYLHLSPRSLERRRLIETVLRREQARLVAFVHDLIPLQHPEYVRPNGPAIFARKLATVLALASGVLVNSEATGAALTALAGANGRQIPIHKAALGVPQLPTPLRKTAGKPSEDYFVVLGTIEPRKNHLLLLRLWRRFIETLGPDRTPRLLIVGRRGWENAAVFDLLDRAEGFAETVRECGRLPDAALRPLLQGARAVLMPSFTEGFGLPVAEALALGVPVIASDAPALREAGGGVPDHLSPVDEAAWAGTILDYAQPNSRLRRRQLVRLACWRPTTWDDHLDAALSFLSEVSR
jgi:glycosyltransferase involved in cell wall biosynthesis